MKAVISKIDLVNIIGKIQNVVPVKPTSPILGTLLLQAENNRLIISATDSMVSIRCSVDATVIEEGAIALPARKIFQLIRELTAPQIKISTHPNDHAEITTGTSIFKIRGMNHLEFPELPDLAGAYEVSLTQTALKDMLSKTAFSASKEDSRYALNGLQLQVIHQKIIFIGTDGKRLAKVTTPVAIDAGLSGSYLFPLKAIEEMIKMLEETDAPATLALTHDKVSLQSGHFILITKLLTGQYPDVERVIPARVAHDFAIHREELMSLLRQVSLFTSDQSSSVRFSFETGQLHLAATSNEIGEGRVSMPVDYVGSKLEIAFNPFYFLDILRHSKDETVRFGLNDSHNPGMITDTTNALFVIMPMRLSEAPPAAVHETNVV